MKKQAVAGMLVEPQQLMVATFLECCLEDSAKPLQASRP